MATITLDSVAVNIKLNNGTTTSGTVRTVNVPLGGSSSRTLSKTEYTSGETAFATKVIAVANALSAVLSKTVYSTILVTNSGVSN